MSAYPVHDGYKVVHNYTIPDAVKPLAPDQFMARFLDVIEPGLRSDTLLEIMPKLFMVCKPKVVGVDYDGFIVEWHYPDVIFTLAYSKSSVEAGYYIQQIQVKDVNH